MIIEPKRRGKEAEEEEIAGIRDGGRGVPIDGRAPAPVYAAPKTGQGSTTDRRTDQSIDCPLIYNGRRRRLRRTRPVTSHRRSVDFDSHVSDMQTDTQTDRQPYTDMHT